MNEVNKKISIIGGGFSGLTLAYELNRLGFEIEIFEKKEWGGLIGTLYLPTMQIETAANAFLNSDKLQEISKKINCPLYPIKKTARRRYIFRNQPRRWPIGFPSTLLLIFKLLKYSLFRTAELFPRKQESIEQYVLRVFNSEILEYLVSPALQGIYAGDVKRMSASLILKPFFQRKKQNVRKGSVAPKEGMGEFIRKLKSYLEEKGVRFHNKKIENVHELDGIQVFAVPPKELAEIFDKKWAEINAIDLLRVTLSFQSSAAKINGFGILFPEVEKFNSLGVLANTQIFENRGTHYNESWILGGANAAQLLKLSDNEILQKINQDRKRILKTEEQIQEYHIIRYPQTLIHYDLTLENFLNQYNLDKYQNVYFTGNFLGQLGLSRILEQNVELAKKIKEKYG